MSLQIQPPEIRRQNAKLGFLMILLMAPSLYWISGIIDTDEIAHLPRWLLAVVVIGNLVVAFTVLGLVRRHLIQKRREDRTRMNAAD